MRLEGAVAAAKEDVLQVKRKHGML